MNQQPIQSGEVTDAEYERWAREAVETSRQNALNELLRRVKTSGDPRESCLCGYCRKTFALMRALEKSQTDLDKVAAEADWTARKSKPYGWRP